MMLPTLLWSQASLTEEPYPQEEQLADWLYQEAIDQLIAIPTRDVISASPTEFHTASLSALQRSVAAALQDIATNPDRDPQPLIDLIQRHAPHPALEPAYLALGSHYYNRKAYQQAIDAYEHVNSEHLDRLSQSEYNFKKGYCHFVLQEFAQAAEQLDKTKALRNIFYYPTNYYWGMSQYFLGQYDEAVAAFDRVTASSVYQSLIPYYISQIYFAQGQYDLLISYGERVIQQSSTENVKDIRLLLGQAYYKKGLYQESLPHLEYYEANTTTLTKEEFYQLAFTQYRLEYYDRAIDNFLELTLLDSEMGQIASYYLADCYHRTGDQASARSAYRKVSQLDYNPAMQQEARFNYGKLSAEMGYDRAAITAMIGLPASSQYYYDARSVINDLLRTTDDFASAIAIIDDLDQLTGDLKATHQELNYKQAIRLIGDKKPSDAADYLSAVETYPIQQKLVAQARFWKAYLAHEAQDYQNSIALMDQYYPQAKGVEARLDQRTSTAHADYYQGYNYLKLEDFKKASTYFARSVDGLSKSPSSADAMTSEILADALVRAGDCFFKLGQYRRAQQYYDRSIDRKGSGAVYALYQRALIEGLTGRIYDKVITLQDITDLHPKHPYADDAFMQLGDTYLALDRFLPARDAFIRVANELGGPFKNKALLKLGLIAYNQGDPAAALNYYQRIYANNPTPSESQEAILAIEEIYVEELGDADAYFEWLATMPGLEISDFAKDSLNYRVGFNLYEQAKYSAATSAFNKYLDQYTAGFYRHNARYYAAASYAALKSYDDAMRMYDRVIEAGFSAFYVPALRKAAMIAYHHTQDFGKAQRYWELLTEQPLDPDQLYEAQLGALRSAYRDDNYPATQKYGAIVQQSPLAQASEQVSAAFYIGKLAQSNGDHEVALQQYQAVAQQTTNEQAAEARYRIGQIYFEQGMIAEAEQQCEVTNAKSTGYPYWIAKNLLLLSKVYLTKDDLFNARAAAEAVRDNFDEAAIQEEARQLLSQIKEEEQQRDRIKTNDGQLELDNGK